MRNNEKPNDTRAIFFDRDGVLNKSVTKGGRPYAPTSLAGFELYPDAAHAIRRVHDAGYLAIVVTNQNDVSEGKISRVEMEAMNEALRAATCVDAIYVCTDRNETDRYKPAPGMLREAAKDWNIVLERSAMIGDRWRDVDAGASAGCLTVFIDHGYTEQLRQVPDFTVKSLSAAVDIALARL